MCVQKDQTRDWKQKKYWSYSQNQHKKRPKPVVWLKLGMRCQKTEKITFL
jgi:hypothetical protein